MRASCWWSSIFQRLSIPSTILTFGGVSQIRGWGWHGAAVDALLLVRQSPEGAAGGGGGVLEPLKHGVHQGLSSLPHAIFKIYMKSPGEVRELRLHCPQYAEETQPYLQ